MLTTTIKVILIDECVLFREALKIVIESTGEFRVAGECEAFRNVLRLVRRFRPALAVIDEQALRQASLSAVRAIARQSRGLRIVVMGAERNWRVPAELGLVHGCLSRRQSPVSVLQALRTVAAGGTSFDATEAASGEADDRELLEAPATPHEALSARHSQIVRLLAAGKSSKEIANILNLSPETIRTYRRNMMKKLSLSNLAQVTAFAVAHGLAAPPGC